LFNLLKNQKEQKINIFTIDIYCLQHLKSWPTSRNLCLKPTLKKTTKYLCRLEKYDLVKRYAFFLKCYPVVYKVLKTLRNV